MTIWGLLFSHSGRDRDIPLRGGECVPDMSGGTNRDTSVPLCFRWSGVVSEGIRDTGGTGCPGGTLLGHPYSSRVKPLVRAFWPVGHVCHVSLRRSERVFPESGRVNRGDRGAASDHRPAGSCRLPAAGTGPVGTGRGPGRGVGPSLRCAGPLGGRRGLRSRLR